MHNGFEDLDLDRLRRRRSEKWRMHPPDVLPAFIAEMDYDMAEPVLAALRTALDLSDCGYAALANIGETFAAFAQARHDWTVDPGRVHLVPGRLLGERLPGARYVPPEASFLAWVDCAGLGLGPEPAEVFLDRGRVALGRGLNFGAPGDGFVRVTIGTSSALLSAIVDRMAAAAGLAGAEEAAG